jgi:hypothetical protein
VAIFFRQLAWIKRVAALLLLVCLFLPLSRCDGKANMESGKASPDQVFYGAEMIQSAIEDLNQGHIADLGFLLMILSVFFAPVATLAAKRFWEPLLVLAASGFAGYFLYYWVIVVPNHAMIGGVLAIAAWSVLIIVSIAQIIDLRRRATVPPALAAR